MNGKYWFSIVGALALLAAVPAWADEAASAQRIFWLGTAGGPAVGDAAFFAADEAADEEMELKPGEYWLGLECSPADPTLRAQLKLPEGKGLVVHMVAPDSPAAKAGLKQHDVLVKAGDKPLGGLKDLIEAVDAAKDKKLALEVVREGKSQKIDVTPARRPEGARAEGGLFRVPVPPPGAPDLEAVRKWLEQVKPGEGMRFHFIQPGMILPPGAPVQPPLPDGMSVSVSKSGGEPARIVVKQGDKKWEVTENELDKLPKEVRTHVEHLLGRIPAGPAEFDRLLRFPDGQAAPGAVLPKIERPLAPVRPRADMQQQLDKQKEQLEKLEKQLDLLRKSIEKGQDKGGK